MALESESNEDKETLTFEMFLIQELLTLQTEYDVNNLDPSFFKVAIQDILSNYMELKSYNLRVIDQIVQILHASEQLSEFEVCILQLKMIYFKFLQDHEQDLGKLTLTGKFQAEDYDWIKNFIDEHTIAFVKDFKEDYFSIWYIDPPGSNDGPSYDFVEA